MASTTFQDYNQNNPIVAAWLNDVNGNTYTPAGTKTTALQSAAAWVRFSIVGGVVTIQQSVNVSSVVRSSPGVYVVTYAAPLTNVNNCYSINMNVAGFVGYTADAAGSVTIDTTNISNVAFDPGNVSFVVFGAG
jgi:hypothetical protein